MTIAWITGGGTGIGRALAERLYHAGARVVISGRRNVVLEETVRELKASPGPGELMSIAGDASDSAHVRDVVARTKDRWGGAITLLINNAGANDYHRFFETPAGDYQKSFEINCLSAIRATEGVLPGMRDAGEGAIVNISSVYGRWASSNSASYSVGKFAVAGYTDVLRQALVDTSIHIMGVFPGFIETAMTLPFVQPGSMKSRFGKTPDQLAEKILQSLRRKKAELCYPWYVPWVWRFHRWMPVLSDRVARRVKR